MTIFALSKNYLDYLLHFFIGVIISFLAAIPVGPINLAVMEAAINNRKGEAYRISAGCAISEWVYCLVAVLGVNLVFIGTDNDSFLSTIRLISIPLLFILGMFNLLKKIDLDKEKVGKSNHKKGFLMGLTINFLNPLLLPGWLFMAGFLRSNHYIKEDYILLVILSLGSLMGAFGFEIFLAEISHRWKKIMSPRTHIIANRSIGVLFISFAVYELGKFIFNYFNIKLL